MIEKPLYSLARRCVPGTGEPQLAELRAGLVNRSFEVQRDDRRFVLRVNGEGHGQPGAPGVDRDWECRVLHAAAAGDLAPAVVLCEPREGVLVTSWVAGIAWSAAQASSAAAQAQVADLARRVHALPLPAPLRCMDVNDWRDLYWAALMRGTLDPQRRAALEEADAVAGTLLRQLAQLPPATRRLCHSDLHRHNLLWSGQHCWLIDWEYAHAGDPFWDLAGWARSNELSVQTTHSLLRCYLQQEPATEHLQRLSLLLRLFDFICLLWGELAAVQSPREP